MKRLLTFALFLIAGPALAQPGIPAKTIMVGATPLPQVLDTKANTVDLTTGLAGKVDSGTYNAGLSTKADQAAVASALATKADATAMATALGLKANASDMTSALRLKANSTDVAMSISSAVAPLAPIASPALTGVPTAPTAPAGTSTTQIATTGFVTGAIGTAPLAPLASPAFSGTPTVPTAATGTSTTQAASTAFVGAAVSPVQTQVTTNTSALATFAIDVTQAPWFVVADGTTDQSAKLTAAFASGAKSFRIPCASQPYMLLGTVTVPSNVKIAGDGWTCTTLSVPNNVNYAFDAVGSNNVEISGLKLLASYTKSYTITTARGDNRYGMSAIYSSGSNVRIHDMWIDGFTTGVDFQAWNPISNTNTADHYNNEAYQLRISNVDFGIIHKGQINASTHDIQCRDITLTPGSPNPQHCDYDVGGATFRNTNSHIYNIDTTNCNQSAAVQVKFTDGLVISGLRSDNAAALNVLGSTSFSITNVSATNAQAQVVAGSGSSPTGAFGLITTSGDQTTRSIHGSVSNVTLNMATDEAQAAQFFADDVTVRDFVIVMNRTTNNSSSDVTLTGQRNSLDLTIFNAGAGSGNSVWLRDGSTETTNYNDIRIKALFPNVMVKLDAGVSATNIYYSPATTSVRIGNPLIMASGTASNQTTVLVRDPTEQRFTALSGGSTSNINALTASRGTRFIIPISDASPYVLPNPNESNPAYTPVGTTIELVISNTSTAALGTISWGTLYKIRSFAAPGAGLSVSVPLRFDGTNWVQL